MDVEISVVIPTFNRRESLRKLLDSIAAQTLPRSRFEVIVASDGSTDGTIEMLGEFKGRFENLRVLELKNGGPGAARNAGARAAGGRYLAFTDDDCLAAPDWLEQILKTFEKTGAVGIQGKTSTDRMARTPLTHQVEVLAPMLTSVPTCNAAYLRKAFVDAGGFDESFRFAHDEDADLAWRVEELGAIVFAPEVHVIHPPRRDGFWKRARWLRGLESDFLLYYKNPAKYRKYISPSPWWTIYWKIFFVGQFWMTRSCFRYLAKPFKPEQFLIGLGLVLARWYNLIRFLPHYWKAQRFYRSAFAIAEGAPVERAGETPGD